MSKIKLVVIEPLIPLYRVPLYESVAAHPGVDLTLLADIITPNQLNQYKASEHQFKVMDLPDRRFGPFLYRIGLFRWFTILQPEVVILKGNPRDLTQMVAVLWCRLRGIKVIVWSMFYRIGPRRIITDLMMRYIVSIAHCLFSYGERGKRELASIGVPADKVVVLHNCIDTRSIRHYRDQVTFDAVHAFKQRYELVGKRILLQVVRMTDIKRTDLLLEGFSRLCAHRNDLLLILIGGGPLEEEMKDLADRLAITEYTRFVGPLYDESELALWYRCADVFVMATCIGLSIHHAMAYGVPVVTDDNVLTQTAEFEVLQDGVNGLTYRSGDLDDFASKVESILADSDLHAELSRNAIKRVEEDYQMDSMVKRFTDAVIRLKASSH